MCMGRGAIRSLSLLASRHRNNRVYSAAGRRGSLGKIEGSRQYYNTEAKSVVEDGPKSFDLILPKRLGQDMGAKDRTQFASDALEWLQIHTVNHELKQVKKTQSGAHKLALKSDRPITPTDSKRKRRRKPVEQRSEEISQVGHELSSTTVTGQTAEEDVMSEVLKQSRKSLKTQKLRDLSSLESKQGISYRREARGSENFEKAGGGGNGFDWDAPLSALSDEQSPNLSSQSDSWLSEKPGIDQSMSSEDTGALTTTQQAPYSLSRPQDSPRPEQIPQVDNTVRDKGNVTTKSVNLRKIFPPQKQKDMQWPDWKDERQTEVLREEAKEELSVETALEEGELREEVHILGMGAVGKFVAHSLAGASHPPKITLLTHNPLNIQNWVDEGERITLVKQGKNIIRSGFNIESSATSERTRPTHWNASFGYNLDIPVKGPTTPIDSLIVTTSATSTVQALIAIRHRLRPSSTICFIHDGLGVIEEVNSIVFPDPQQRPTYMLAKLKGSGNITTNRDRHFVLDQRGDVSLACSKLPQRSVFRAQSGPAISRTNFSWSLSSLFLIRSVSRAPELNVKPLGHKSFIRDQLSDVIAHAVIGPVSVMYDYGYIDLLESHHARLAMRGLLEELSRVVLAFPELKKLHNVEQHFSVTKLEVLIRRILRQNHQTSNTMLELVRSGSRTDIDYYNGYLLLRAAELRVECPLNEMMVNLVKGKQSMVGKQNMRVVPLVGV